MKLQPDREEGDAAEAGKHMVGCLHKAPTQSPEIPWRTPSKAGILGQTCHLESAAHLIDGAKELPNDTVDA